MLKSLMLAACAALLFASNAFAQCGANGTGQCGAPSAASLSASQQLAQLQLNNGLAASSSAASSAVPTFTPAPQFVQAVPQFYGAPSVAAYAGYGALQPGMVFVQLPAATAAAAPATEANAVAQQPVQSGLFTLAAFPGAAAASGASAAASSSAAAPGLTPTPVLVPTTAASGGCASGNCGAQGGLLSRLGSRGGLLGQRSSSRSVSISRSRVR